MKQALLLPLLLLGTVAAFHLENPAPHLDSQDTQADLSQDLEGSGDQGGELAQTEEEIESEEEQEEASGYQHDCGEEKAMEWGPSALDNNLQCPKKEDTVEIVGSPGCKTCRYILVQTPRRFRRARKICTSCYGGKLVSIHSYCTNNQLRCLASGVNGGQVWIGGKVSGSSPYWLDGSCWNYSNWAPGQPACGDGSCILLCTRGEGNGHQ
ncbi:proteoglycan 3, partial [Sturnira hondurensis]|uniref:proteoglycan 3 n=1 Tax=Sturnira hondurensis TaxID=192404 RepID=UPI0018792757